jgi:hypothetical protein
MISNEWAKADCGDGACVEIFWHKASACEAGACVEVGVWKKSQRSSPSGDNCVEVCGEPDGGVLVRDTKDNGSGPVLSFTESEWKAFISGAKDGEFDLA